MPLYDPAMEPTHPHEDVTVIHGSDDLTGDGALIDIVTVPHNDINTAETEALFAALHAAHPAQLTLIAVSNRRINRGFAKACNMGAGYGRSPIVGFLNPDVVIQNDSWVGQVVRALERDPHLMVVGNRFGKPANELRHWGVTQWVCGAVMFVRRTWWEHLGGFDEQFVWSWEETDFVRRTEQAGYGVADLKLPIAHAVQGENTDYKREHFDRGRKLYRAKHGLPTA